MSAARPALPRRRQSGLKARVLATNVHPLLKAARAEFLQLRSVKNGGYLKPYKKLLPDVSVSAAQLDHALSLASKLYNEFECFGARVVIAPGDRRWHCRETPVWSCPL